MNPNGQKRDVLRFGTFELDLGGHELRKGGALVKLQSQQLQLLTLLAERAGQVVSREEIRRSLWDDETFVATALLDSQSLRRRSPWSRNLSPQIAGGC